jgi:hypothetical protein
MPRVSIQTGVSGRACKSRRAAGARKAAPGPSTTRVYREGVVARAVARASTVDDEDAIAS